MSLAQAASEGYLGIYEEPEPALALIAPTAAEIQAVAGHPIGPDYAHFNWDDGPVSAGAIHDADFVVLKVSEATSYGWADSWWPPNRDRVRAAGKPVGGYHFLRPRDPEGQIRFYLSKLGKVDMVRILDVEDGAITVDTCRAAVREAKRDGSKVMGYGRRWFIDHGVTHADVGFDFAWKPRYGPSTLGETATMWQYSNGVFNGTALPSGLNGKHSDMSVVLTALPLIGGGQDVTGDDIVDGWRFRKENPDKPLPQGKSDGFAVGWHMREGFEQKASGQGPPGPAGPRGEPGPPGPPGPRGGTGFREFLRRLRRRPAA